MPERASAQLVTVEAAVEVRTFPKSPLFPVQEDAVLSPSFHLEPELQLDWDDGATQLTFRPFARWDAHDERRTHADVRELSLTYLADRWSLMVGAGRVFWGVTEVNHLVDIVNQTDGVEDIDTEDKLGQPMVNLTVEGSWGALDLFWLPYFRERTFPDPEARLRGPVRVLGDALYESGAEAWHQDFAARWSQVFGAADVGVSAFRGTGREPVFVPSGAGTGPTDPDFSVLALYQVIDQVGVDIQWTGDRALWKLEAMTRGGQGDRFFAVSAGIEYTLYQAFSGASDLGLLAEVMIDGRDAAAPQTLFDNDVFGGVRWALNDAADTAILGGVVVDYDVGDVFALIEAERRIQESWTVELEARLLGNTDPGSFVNSLRRDSFVTLRASRFW